MIFVKEIDHALLFSDVDHGVCLRAALRHDWTEGQLFGPMAQTYAFSLAAALVLAVTPDAGAVPCCCSRTSSRSGKTCWFAPSNSATCGNFSFA